MDFTFSSRPKFITGCLVAWSTLNDESCFGSDEKVLVWPESSDVLRGVGVSEVGVVVVEASFWKGLPVFWTQDLRLVPIMRSNIRK
jgi:hypothetical protein